MSETREGGLAGKSVGVIGLGAMGLGMAQVLAGLGSRYRSLTFPPRR